MSENITLTADDLEEIIRTALRLGANAGGVKHKRLVQGVMEEAREKAVPKYVPGPFPADFTWTPPEPLFETGCGIEECCPSVPVNVLSRVKEIRHQKAADALGLPSSDKSLIRDLSDDQIDQVLRLLHA